MSRHMLTALIILLLAGGAAMAQNPTARGNALFSGSSKFDFVNTSEDNSSVTRVSLAAEGGWFVSDGVFLGGILSFENVNYGGHSASAYLLGPEVGYFFRTGGTVHPFVAGSLTFGTDDNDVKVLDLGIRGGALFMVSKAVGITVSLNLDMIDLSKGSYSRSQTRVSVPVGFAVVL